MDLLEGLVGWGPEMSFVMQEPLGQMLIDLPGEEVLFFFILSFYF